MTSQVKPRNFNNIDNTNLDYQWYNTSVYNDTGSDLIARYDEIRTYPYLDHIEDYEYTITRFKVPSYNFPLLELTNLAPDGHSLELWVTMQDYNTIINNPGAPARVFHREPLLFPSTTGKYQIFDIQTFVNAVNDALNLCYAGITAAWNVNHQGDPAITLAERVTEPVIRLDPNNNKFYIATLTEQNQESVYYPSIGGNDNKFIVVSFSPALYSYFHGFATTSISNEKYVILLPEQGYREGGDEIAPVNIADNRDLKTYAEYPCFNAFHKFTRILFTTTMPIISENFGYNSVSGANKSTNLLTDYEVTLDDNSTIHRDVYMYYLNNDYRWSNFGGNGDIRRIDWQVWLQNQETRELVPVNIPPRGEVSCKFLFRKRINNKIMMLLRFLSEETEHKNNNTTGSGRLLK